MPTTRHYNASSATGPTQADEMAKLALWHQLPERGHADSTDRMLDTVQAIIDGAGTGYEFNKVRDWVKRFPLRAVAAKVENGWETWEPARLEEIALAVLMNGWSTHRTAVHYGTTAETVDAVLKAYRLQLKRLY
jgi:hypothetical protein